MMQEWEWGTGAYVFIYRGEFRAAKGGRPSQGFDPLLTHRVPLCTILRHPFLVTDPKNFLKAPSAPVYTNFEVERAP